MPRERLQIVFFDLGDVDAVITDLSILNIIKTVQIRLVMVVFPAPVEPTKAIFCPGCAYNVDIMENDLVRNYNQSPHPPNTTSPFSSI